MCNSKIKPSIAIGVSDFETIISTKSMYIDKTLMIKELIDSPTQVTLITRPRRFGKSLNMSMLASYFDITKDTKKMFDSLNISKVKDIHYNFLNSAPTISLNFGNLKNSNSQDIIENFKSIISDVYVKNKHLLAKLSEMDAKYFNDIANKEATIQNYINSILKLNQFMYIFYGKKAIILLDEYDVPIQTAYRQDFYKEIMDVMSPFFVSTFKDNEYLYKALIIGVSRVSGESLFSGLNNPEIATLLENRYADKFGITDNELDSIIDIYGLEDEKEIMKQWYNGYRCGEVQELYNTWSIINYINNNSVKRYWVNTTSTDLIDKLAYNSIELKPALVELMGRKFNLGSAK